MYKKVISQIKKLFKPLINKYSYTISVVCFSFGLNFQCSATKSYTKHISLGHCDYEGHTIYKLIPCRHTTDYG